MTLANLDLNKQYTYADYFKWKFEERVELIKGIVFPMSPAPNRMHQKISGIIYRQLTLANLMPGCEVYYAPFDVRLPKKGERADAEIINVLQPDIRVVCDRSKLDDRGCLGAPDLVVEILSPGNSKKEIKLKYDTYQEAGVREYWIVSPQNEWVKVHVLVNGMYQESPFYVEGDVVTSSVVPDFTLSVTDLFSIEDQ